MSEPQRDVQQVVTLLRELVARQAMGYMERFEADAEAFYRETGLMAPGKSMPLGMPVNDEARDSGWYEWTRARSARWTQAMADAADLLVEDAHALRAAATLAKDVRGCIALANHELRAALGNTNVNVLESWANEVLRPAPDAQKAGV